MALCPFAKQMPLGWDAPPITPTQIILHSAVTPPGYNLWAQWNNGPPNGVACHLYVRGDGSAEQYLDTSVRASAQYAGNLHGISVETEGLDPDHNPWNDAELATLARLIDWVHVVHGIPRIMCAHEQAPGVGYHAMWGVPDQRPTGWNWDAHTCPGAARIAQIPALIVAGPSPGPTPPTLEEDRMSASVNADGRAEMFDVVDGTVSHYWQKKAGRWDTGAHASFDNPAGLKAVAVSSYPEHSDGHLTIVVRFDDDSRRMQWQTAPGGGWSGWRPFLA